MRALEQRDTTVGDPIAINEQVVQRIREISGHRVFFHYAMLDKKSVVCGGLHETREAAEQAKTEFIIAEVKAAYGKAIPIFELPDDDKAKRIKEYEETQIIWLPNGLEYIPFGQGRRLKHAEEDGTHGSKIKPWPKITIPTK